MTTLFFFVFVFFGCIYTSSTLKTTFTFSKSQRPVTSYDSVAYANMTIKINQPNDDGPGQRLYVDPMNPNKEQFVGNTLSRDAFDTQFILDMEKAIGINRNRVFVIHVSKATNYFADEATSVMVQFIFLERNDTTSITLLEAISSLNRAILNLESSLYKGTNVTKDADHLFGVVVRTFDVSLKLFYSIDIVGGDSVRDGYFLNQGGLGVCDSNDANNNSYYCEFETFFENDIANALEISLFRIQTLFVTTSGLDSVLVFFRIFPPVRGTNELTSLAAVQNLSSLVKDYNSLLYQGNVTVRVDPTWGVSGGSTSLRPSEPIFTYKHYEIDKLLTNNAQRLTQYTAYDRCKANRRCNWGVVKLNQSLNTITFYQQLYAEGNLFPVDLFLDFEDWRIGSRGAGWGYNFPPQELSTSSNPNIRSILGAHFSPFNQESKGPTIPAYRLETNQGLILDHSSLILQVQKQESFVSFIAGKLYFLQENIDIARMDSKRRARVDVRKYLEPEIQITKQWLDNEIRELMVLNSSQCSYMLCSLLFDTSTLTLTGIINSTGEVRKTKFGTEIAVFTFNSIYLGPEVQVHVVGQRALGLASRTSAVINTTISSNPGTLGGMPGGLSVGRYYPDDELSDNPTPILISQLSERNNRSFVVNNVNGPGSGSLLITTFVIKLEAFQIPEVQVIRTSAESGQTLSGGFILYYKQFATTIIPHDASSKLLKQIIEDNLNYYRPTDKVSVLPSQNRIGITPGVGIVGVKRRSYNDAGGYEWSITFNTAIGNVDQLTIKSLLQGKNASITIFTSVQGNDISGSFSIRFNNEKSGLLASNISATNLKNALLELPSVITADVTRNDPTGNCDDGLCTNGPLPSHGYIWTCLVTTNSTVTNIAPTSPTAPEATVPSSTLYADIDDVHLFGEGVRISVQMGTATSIDDLARSLRVKHSFPLAYGGGGASYGGVGGEGYTRNPVGNVYNNAQLSDLLGGSGGAMRSGNPYEINRLNSQPLSPSSPNTPFKDLASNEAISMSSEATISIDPSPTIPHGRGGAGGGAIEIVASNDIIIGSFGVISMNGGHGEQASEGGGGGGSGGAILLAAGGICLIEGSLSANGGDGGFGGYQINEYSGGGGGGGRIAVYGEAVSLLNSSIVTVSGGNCGRFENIEQVAVTKFNVNITLGSLLPLSDDGWTNIGIKFISSNVNAINNDFTLNSLWLHSTNTTFFAFLTFSFNAMQNLSVNIPHQLEGAVGTTIASVILGDVIINNSIEVLIEYMSVEYPSSCSNLGNPGTLYTQAELQSSMYVKQTNGAENTSHALFISNREKDLTSTNTVREVSFAENGPTIALHTPSRPSRVTYYVRISGDEIQSKKSNLGTLFRLMSHVSNSSSNVIGVFVGQQILHGANFGSLDTSGYNSLLVIDPYPTVNRWYKVDIRLVWNDRSYNDAGGAYTIAIDDTVVALNQPFQAQSIDSIRISVNHAIDVWYDEIYVGFDNTMEFNCPTSNRTGIRTPQPTQQGWSYNEVHGGNSAGYTEYNRMMRHYNHLATTGTVPFDGNGAVSVDQDIKLQFSTGDYLRTQGNLAAGSLQYLTKSLRSGKTASERSSTLVTSNGLWYRAPDGEVQDGAGDGRYFWYTEYNYNSSLSSSLNGGIVACSSQDLKTWRFEGVVFQYANLSDLVYGSEGPFSLARPVVKFNAATSSYVMWAVMDDASRSFAFNAIMTSNFEDGPFFFRRCFYPDGNQTRDQVIFFSDNASVNGILGRTYYLTVQYILPQAIMQPVWESVKKRESGDIDYRANYHRAWYNVGYDNYNDIYLQRWRSESEAWNVSCVNKLTGAVRYIAYEALTTGAICKDPEEYKVTTGQGNPVITSRFVSPEDINLSWWRPTSVPAVVSQPWAKNYIDGICGIRDFSDGYSELDPGLERFEPPDRSNCSNIADNPIFATVQDKLIGVLKIVTTRRAKYLAASQLTYDYMDTTGRLQSFEGELTSGYLISMITSLGQFSFDSGDTIQSTFVPPRRTAEFDTAYDYKIRFSQYVRNYNDRASYSLACVLDNTCPVNFRNQITSGNK